MSPTIPASISGIVKPYVPVVAKDSSKSIPQEILDFIHAVNEAPSTAYANEHDEVGACVCCYELSYRAHKPDCIFARAKALAEKYQAGRS